MTRDFGRTKLTHLWIDLDSWKHPEVWLHVFRKQLYYRDSEGNLIDDDKLIVVQEGGFVFGGEIQTKVMSREEFKVEYEVDVPELFEGEGNA